MAFDVDHDILWFEISVDDVMIMDLLQSEQNLSDVKSGFFLIHFSELFNQVEEFPACVVLHHKDKIVFRLK